MTACVSDLHLEARLEFLAARKAVAARDDANNRARLEAARTKLDELFDAANDCE